MRKQTMRACVAVAFVMMLSGSPVEAQIQSTGWPEPAVETKPAKTPVVPKPAAKPASKAVAAAAPAKAAVAPKTANAKTAEKKIESAVVIVAPAPVAEKVVARAVAAPAPIDTPAPVDGRAPVDAPVPVSTPAPVDSAVVEVVQLLQQQSELLKKLASEMEAQRAVIKDQQDKITSLELKAVPAAAPAAAPAPPPPPPPPPAITVETGGVKLKVSGLFQGWYTASSGSIVDTFRLRRAELKFAGDISPRIKWTVMVDPAKALSLSTTTSSMSGQSVVTGTSVSQSGRIMQDAFVALNWKPSMSIEVGQQKVPLGIEGTASSGKLDVVERALFMTDKARGAGYADIRDLGVMVRGKVANGYVEYSGGVFNGLGEQFNDLDRNEAKTMVGRVVTKVKFVKGLQIGASMARDRFELFNETARERQGVDLAYTRGNFGFRTEYMGGRDAAVTRQGGYAQVTARLHKIFTLVGRYDSWDPDTRTEQTATAVTERDWLGGFTYVLHPSGVWLQANYIRKTFGGLVPSRNVLITNVQTAW